MDSSQEHTKENLIQGSSKHTEAPLFLHIITKWGVTLGEILNHKVEDTDQDIQTRGEDSTFLLGEE